MMTHVMEKNEIANRILAEGGKVTGNYDTPETGYQFLEAGYKEDHTNPDPSKKRNRDKLARELRKNGWTVTVRTIGFSDLLGATVFFIRAERRIPIQKPADNTSAGEASLSAYAQ